MTHLAPSWCRIRHVTRQGAFSRRLRVPRATPREGSAVSESRLAGGLNVSDTPTSDDGARIEASLRPATRSRKSLADTSKSRLAIPGWKRIPTRSTSPRSSTKTGRSSVPTMYAEPASSPASSNMTYEDASGRSRMVLPSSNAARDQKLPTKGAEVHARGIDVALCSHAASKPAAKPKLAVDVPPPGARAVCTRSR